ncbi:hypothetical protein BVI1335_1360012 [Burkholderia vietnamiensis]|nr:hypothetical protein BVI1335_1360012 [Burkholderia vietnamiensis]
MSMCRRDPVIARNLVEIFRAVLLLQKARVEKQALCLWIKRRQVIRLMRAAESEIRAHGAHVGQSGPRHFLFRAGAGDQGKPNDDGVSIHESVGTGDRVRSSHEGHERRVWLLGHHFVASISHLPPPPRMRHRQHTAWRISIKSIHRRSTPTC